MLRHKHSLIPYEHSLTPYEYSMTIYGHSVTQPIATSNTYGHSVAAFVRNKSEMQLTVSENKPTRTLRPPQN